MRSKLLWGVLFLCLAWSVPAGALMVPLTVADLVEEADQVVSGRVSATESLWSADGRSIVTQAALEVGESYKGGLGGQTVVLQYLGGEVGDVGMMVSDQPSLEVNEEVIVFLKPEVGQVALGAKIGGLLSASAGDATVYQVVGSAQGKYSLAGSAASKSGFATIGSKPGAAAQIALTDLVSQIKEEVGNAGR